MNTGEGSGADDWQGGTEEKSEQMAKLRPDRRKPQNTQIVTWGASFTG